MRPRWAWKFPTTATVATLYERAVQAGFGGDNINGVARLFFDDVESSGGRR